MYDVRRLITVMCADAWYQLHNRRRLLSYNCYHVSDVWFYLAKKEVTVHYLNFVLYINLILYINNYYCQLISFEYYWLFNHVVFLISVRDMNHFDWQKRSHLNFLRQVKQQLHVNNCEIENWNYDGGWGFANLH